MRFNIILIFLVLLLQLINTVAACELTTEYKKARNKIMKEITAPFMECRESVVNAQYWYRFTQCFEAGDGKKVGGGCAHVAAGARDRYKKLNIDDSFCFSLKLTDEKKQEILDLYADEQKIVKCK